MPRVSDLQRAFSNLTLLFLYLGQLIEERGARRSLASMRNSFQSLERGVEGLNSQKERTKSLPQGLWEVTRLICVEVRRADRGQQR